MYKYLASVFHFKFLDGEDLSNCTSITIVLFNGRRVNEVPVLRFHFFGTWSSVQEVMIAHCSLHTALEDEIGELVHRLIHPKEFAGFGVLVSLGHLVHFGFTLWIPRFSFVFWTNSMHPFGIVE